MRKNFKKVKRGSVMKISIVGMGYIGLPTAAILASSQGNNVNNSEKIEVIGVDINTQIVDIINNGNIHIIEPGLEEMVKNVVNNGFLRASTNYEKADVFIITVPTPFKGNYEPDLSYIEAAISSIAPLLEKGNLVILESTSPIGTTEKLVEWMKEIRPDLNFPFFGKENNDFDISVAYCPERVLPGKILHELIDNDRIIGGLSRKCSDNASKLYKLFLKANCLITDCRTAELSKLVENSYRDVNIAFANELSMISDKFGINVWELIKLANHHPRVNILQPGPGVGGHCIAVDPWFVIHSAPEYSQLIKAARLVNDNKPKFILEKVKDAVSLFNKSISDLNIACLGLTFKPNIDDLRESPALAITMQINELGFNKLFLVEPNINSLPDSYKKNSSELVLLEEAILSSDIVILLVDHDEFKSIDLELLSGKKILDTRGIWE
jgi:UDP-N-acetyl-D-mannosaminuronic acid dehydrogenase